MKMNDESRYNRLNIAFAGFLSQRSRLEKEQKQAFYSIIAELSYQQSQGHSCIYLNTAERQVVMSSGLATSADLSPLIVEDNRLYTHRYWSYEQRLATKLKRLISQRTVELEVEPLLNRYFIELIDEVDWQREAAKIALTNAFSIITGGPGTGKTTTVVKILALLQEIYSKQSQPLYMALAAPTGKAAMRLQESIGISKAYLPCSESIKNMIPETVTTLHHLLGAQPPSPYFKHDAGNPLAYDLVVIDESSMVDLALMSKLVDALKPNARLILLGDQDQLASVESGAVLADLAAALPENTVSLKKSHRFQGEIKALADAVNQQAVDKAWDMLERGGEQVALLKEDVIDYIADQYSDYLMQIEENKGISDVFSAFNQFQVLCSNRQGENGVVDINRKVEDCLNRQHKIQVKGAWYVGRPVMVMQNNPSMQLYNGDTGLCLFDHESNRIQVYFQRADGSIKKVLPSRLPAHETVFAMTIHKSQGSEFEQCLCVLPGVVNPVLTKELLYTAITRAKQTLKMVAAYAIFSQALGQKVQRVGGLFDKLAGNA